MTVDLEHARTAAPKHTSLNFPGLLRRQCACGNHTVSGEDCADCAKKKRDLWVSDTGRAIRRSREQGPEWTASAQVPAPATFGVSHRAFDHDFSRVQVRFRPNKISHNQGYHFSGQAGAMTGMPAAVSSEPGVEEIPGPRQDALPDADTPGPGQDAVPVAAELPGSPSVCVVHAAIPYSRSGIIRSGGSVTENFEVRVEWSSAKHRGAASYCAAECGEYHQFVKGHMRSSANQDGSGATDVSARLFGGKALDPNVFQEDGRDDNPQARYGHRKEKQTMNETYEPDRATGSKYVGKDSPGVMIGTFADFDLTFVGKLVDKCNGTETVSAPWRVFYRGLIRP